MGLDILGQLGGVSLLTILVGACVSAILVIILQTVSGEQKSRAHKRRMSVAKDDRRRLKEPFSEESAARARDQQRIKRLEATLSRLRLDRQLSDGSLRERLARAGLRRRDQQIQFVLAQFLLPPIAAAAALAAFHFGLRPPHADSMLYVCVGVGGAILGYLLPGLRIDGMAQDRRRAVELALPDALDLMTICVEAGMSLEQSLGRVSKELGVHAVILKEEIDLLSAELAFLGDRRAAFDNFAKRTGAPTAKTIVSGFMQAEKYGTPIGQALRVIAEEGRFNRMAAAETKAASLPAKLTVPMMVFFMPSLFVVILGPAVIQMMEKF